MALQRKLAERRRQAGRAETDLPQQTPRRAADPTGWLMHHRRLARDYESHPHRSEAIIHIAMIDPSRRLTRESTVNWRRRLNLEPNTPAGAKRSFTAGHHGCVHARTRRPTACLPLLSLSVPGSAVYVTSVQLGVDWEEFVLANARLWSANLVTWIDGFAAAFDRPVNETTVEPEMLASYAWGRQVTGPQFVHALDVRNRVARSIGAYFSNRDLLLTPTLPELPVPIGAYTEGSEGADGRGWLAHLFHRSPFTAAFNVAGTPAMSVPLSTDPTTGLPIGIQVAAGYGREDTLFRLAGQLEKAAPWAQRTPAVWAGGDQVG